MGFDFVIEVACHRFGSAGYERSLSLRKFFRLFGTELHVVHRIKGFLFQVSNQSPKPQALTTDSDKELLEMDEEHFVRSWLGCRVSDLGFGVISIFSNTIPQGSDSFYSIIGEG